jgi:LuxR family maltose regulon positive regulatory protein
MPERQFKQIVIQTKLNRPAIGANSVERPRLISRLDDALKGRVTLISAPAGYGKTTLVLQWLAQPRMPVAWFAVDETDSEPDRFLSYVVAAVRTVVPEFGSDIERLLSAPQLPPPEILADAVVNELAALEQPLLIVLDDYHRHTSKTVHEIMTRVLQYLPQQLHVLLLTRRDPPLPLGLWSSRQWLAELRAADLRFTRQETQAFFENRLRKRLSDQTIGLLDRRTEGWAAALQLVQLSLSPAGDPGQLVGRYADCDRSIAEYLMDEVVSRQPSEVIDFLTITAILERFCAPLCDYLLPEHKAAPDTRTIISRIEKENLFLVALDDARMWYRYHHLFHSFLKQHLKEKLSPERISQFHQRAGKWFAGQELVEEALHHFLAAGDVDTAAALLEDNMHSAIDSDLSRRTLARWLAMFPQSAENQHPVLLVAHSHLKMANWNFSGIAQLLDRAEALLRDPAFSIDPTRRQRLEGDYHALRARHLYWQAGDTEGTLRHARQASRIVPRKHRYTHTIVIMYTAFAQALSGRRDEALQLLAEALIEDCAEGSRNMAALLTAQAAIHCYAADLNAAEETAKHILSAPETVAIPKTWQGYAHHFIGSAAYERNLLDCAAEHFGRVVQMRYLVSTRPCQDALLGLALVARARGTRAKAREYVNSARVFALEMNDSYSLKMAESLQTRLALFSDEDPRVPPENGSIIDSNKFWLEIPSLTRAEYQVHRGTPAECAAALHCVEEGLQQAKQHHNTRQVIQFLALKAVALKCAGRLNQALEVLEETLHLAEPLGFVRTFLDRGPLMAELLKMLSGKSPENPYLQRLLDAFAAARPPEKPMTASSGDKRRKNAPLEPHATTKPTISKQPPHHGLTGREIEILPLLAEGLSNKEIAARLYIAPVTVKTHLQHIYKKLNVNKRIEALKKVREMGIIAD